METLAPNIFLVEDDPFYNNVVKNTLEKNNFKVKSFTTSGEYLEAIQSEVPDLVIMDYKLDEANGIDLLERTKLKNANTKVVMLSGVRTLDMVKDAMQKGATAFIHKDNKAFGKIRFYAKKASIEKEVDHDEKIAWIYRIVFITVFVLAMTAMVVMHNFFPEYFNHRG